ncbi:hypothetical protein CerSpe_257200 [Prunus speciosa]
MFFCSLYLMPPLNFFGGSQRSATTSAYDGESNCPEHEKQEQVADGRVDDLLPNVERPQLVRQGQVQEAVDELHTSEGCQNGASCLDCQAEEGQKLSSVSHDFDGDDIMNRTTAQNLA